MIFTAGWVLLLLIHFALNPGLVIEYFQTVILALLVLLPPLFSDSHVFNITSISVMLSTNVELFIGIVSEVKLGGW